MLSKKEEVKISSIADHLLLASKEVEQAIVLYQKADYHTALLKTQHQINVCHGIKQEIKECVGILEKKGKTQAMLLSLSQQEAILEQHTAMLENLLANIVSAEKQTEMAAGIDQESKRQELKKKLKERGGS